MPLCHWEHLDSVRAFKQQWSRIPYQAHLHTLLKLEWTDQIIMFHFHTRHCGLTSHLRRTDAEHRLNSRPCFADLYMYGERSVSRDEVGEGFSPWHSSASFFFVTQWRSQVWSWLNSLLTIDSSIHPTSFLYHTTTGEHAHLLFRFLQYPTPLFLANDLMDFTGYMHAHLIQEFLLFH